MSEAQTHEKEDSAVEDEEPKIVPDSGNVDPITRPSVNIGRTRPQHSSELLAKKEMLTAQTLTFDKTKEEDQQLWLSQTQAFNAINSRLLNSKRTSNQLANYLTIRCKRLSGLFAHDPNDVSFGEGEIGTLRQATICLEQLTKNGQKQFADAQSKVFDETVKKAKELAKVLQHRSDELRSAAEKHKETIISERQVMLNSWNSYEQAMRDSLLNESEDKLVTLAKDPYLLARRYLHDLAVYRGGQANYSRAMKKIFDEVRLHDGRRISGLKEILLDHLLAEKNILINTLQLLDESLNAVKSIDREADVQAFLGSAKELCANEEGKMIFDKVPNSEVDSLIVERLRSHVQHKGILQRQGKLLKSNYKLGQAVITLSGYLHFFDKREDPLPALRLCLKGGIVQAVEDAEPNCFELAVPSSSFLKVTSFMDTYRFKAGDPDSLKEWILNIQDCIERVTPAPTPH